MSKVPVEVLSVSRSAARRATIASTLNAVSLALVAGAVASLLTVAASKFIKLPFDWQVHVGAPMLAAAACGLGWAWSRRWDVLRGARRLDEHGKLEDKIASAIELSSRDADADPFVAIAIRDGIHAAGRVDPRAAVPIRLNNSWAYWPLIAAGAIAFALYVPSVEWNRQVTKPVPSAAERLDAIADVREAIKLASAQSIPETTFETNQRQRDAVANLEKELVQGRVEPSEARAMAAQKLADAANAIEKRWEERRAQSDEIRSRLAKAARDRENARKLTSPDAANLLKALSLGDSAPAAAALDDIRERLAELPAEDREQIAAELERLAERLDSSPQGLQATDATSGSGPASGVVSGAGNDGGYASESRSGQDDEPKLNAGEQQTRSVAKAGARHSTDSTTDGDQQQSDRTSPRRSANLDSSARNDAASTASEFSQSLRDAANEIRSGTEKGDTPSGGTPESSTGEQSSTSADRPVTERKESSEDQPVASQPSDSRTASESLSSGAKAGKPDESSSKPEAAPRGGASAPREEKTTNSRTAQPREDGQQTGSSTREQAAGKFSPQDASKSRDEPGIDQEAVGAKRSEGTQRVDSEPGSSERTQSNRQQGSSPRQGTAGDAPAETTDKARVNQTGREEGNRSDSTASGESAGDQRGDVTSKRVAQPRADVNTKGSGEHGHGDAERPQPADASKDASKESGRAASSSRASATNPEQSGTNSQNKQEKPAATGAEKFLDGPKQPGSDTSKGEAAQSHEKQSPGASSESGSRAASQEPPSHAESAKTKDVADQPARSNQPEPNAHQGTSTQNPEQSTGDVNKATGGGTTAQRVGATQEQQRNDNPPRPDGAPQSGGQPDSASAENPHSGEKGAVSDSTAERKGVTGRPEKPSQPTSNAPDPDSAAVEKRLSDAAHETTHTPKSSASGTRNDGTQVGEKISQPGQQGAPPGSAAKQESERKEVSPTATSSSARPGDEGKTQKQMPSDSPAPADQHPIDRKTQSGQTGGTAKPTGGADATNGGTEVLPQRSVKEGIPESRGQASSGDSPESLMSERSKTPGAAARPDPVVSGAKQGESSRDTNVPNTSESVGKDASTSRAAKPRNETATDEHGRNVTRSVPDRDAETAPSDGVSPSPLEHKAELSGAARSAKPETQSGKTEPAPVPASRENAASSRSGEAKREETRQGEPKPDPIASDNAKGSEQRRGEGTQPDRSEREQRQTSDMQRPDKQTNQTVGGEQAHPRPKAEPRAGSSSSSTSSERPAKTDSESAKDREAREDTGHERGVPNEAPKGETPKGENTQRESEHGEKQRSSEKTTDPSLSNKIAPSLLNKIDPSALNKLDPETIQKYGPELLKKLGPDAIKNLDPELLKKFDPETVRRAAENPAIRRLAEKFRDISPQSEHEQADKDRARAMRDMATQLWNKASPEQRKEMMELAKRLASSDPAQEPSDFPRRPSSRDQGDGGFPESIGTPGTPRDRWDQLDRDAVEDHRAARRVPTEQTGEANDRGANPEGARQASDGVGGESAGDRTARGGVGSIRTPPRGPRVASSASSAADMHVQTEDVRVSGQTCGDRVLAEWLNPNIRGVGVARSNQTVVDGMRVAAEGADRAIEQQTVPVQRAEFVRRVFAKYVERAKQSTGDSAGESVSSPSPPK